MSYQVENETLPSGFRVVVELDSYPESPRDWDNLGKVVLVDRCRYTFGDEVASNEELREIGLDDELLKLPIYLYDHSGITINTSGFSCPWDSGMVGMIYMTKQTAIENWGKKKLAYEIKRERRGTFVYIHFRSAGNVVDVSAREIVTTPSSSGWRSVSSVCDANSGNSSRNSTPR